MKWTDSKNRNSLIKLDCEKKDEPSLHINYEEKRVRARDYNAPRERSNGWSEYKITRTQIVLRKYDNELLSFEKRLWNLFFKIGFPYINKSGKKNIYYGAQEEREVSFSLFGRDKDNYSFIFLDCFAPDNQEQLDAKIMLMREQFAHITDHMQVLLEDNEIVFKYIIAIKGFELTEKQEQIIKECNYTILTEVDLEYFEELHTNLQDAAYYQFCGKLFEGMTIPKIDTRIPAIRGRMGGHRYYAFSIDPQVLLRLSFVLHKTKAHEDAMPTYQRLVKKSRLKSITEFLNNHGFFPNSIVINLDEECAFEEAEVNHDYDTEIGHLIIPQKYRVAYIIDGQHRLMGYAGCKWGNQQIPVVAFENLDKVTQVKLFMEMNENQKAVPKELRLTLYKDLLPTDPRLSQRMYGLRLQIAFSFADHKGSPLKGYVGDGVDRREFTLEYLHQALKYSAIYFGSVNTRTETLDVPGVFFRGHVDDLDSFDSSKIAVRDFLFLCVKALIEGLSGIEKLDNENRANVFIRNIGLNGYLRFVADLVKYKEREIIQTIESNALAANPVQVFEIISPYLQIAFDFMKECDPDEGGRLRSLTGGKAPVYYQRTLQRELHNIDSNFNPAGLEDWIANNSTEVVEEAMGIILQLKTLIKKEFTDRFSDKTGVNDWVADSLPDEISTECFGRQTVFNRNATPEQILEKNLWDFIVEEEFFQIACHPNNDPLIKEDFTFPGMRKSVARNKRYEWIKNILKIEKGCIENHSCESGDLDMLRALYTHFIELGLIQENEQDT